MAEDGFFGIADWFRQRKIDSRRVRIGPGGLEEVVEDEFKQLKTPSTRISFGGRKLKSHPHPNDSHGIDSDGRHGTGH